MSPNAAHATPQPGEMFSGLLVHSRLGEGGMGAAYLASHPILKMPLVVKTFKRFDVTNVFREAQLAARVSSINVVAVLGAGHECGIPFIVQRYIDGVDLEELGREAVEAKWRISIESLYRILLDAARGIHVVHQAGVLHRDIKPANLFLQGDGVTAVGDFGIATDVVNDDWGGPLSGSPYHMAPEQWISQPLKPATDIYALGITAHFLATGRYPFSQGTIAEIRDAHVSERYVPPSGGSPKEAYLFSVVQRMLHKSPEARYQTGEALARVLEVVSEPAPRFLAINSKSYSVGDVKLDLSIGDIAKETSDVIVSASNKWLAMDVGVSAAIRDAAGREVETEAMTHGPVAMGDVVWTTAGNLKAAYVAHAVAALDGAVCIQRATLRVLIGAEKRKAVSIAFPALGTGVGDVPMDLAAKLMLGAIVTFSSLAPRYVRSIHIILRQKHALARWQSVIATMC